MYISPKKSPDFLAYDRVSNGGRQRFSFLHHGYCKVYWNETKLYNSPPEGEKTFFTAKPPSLEKRKFLFSKPL